MGVGSLAGPAESGSKGLAPRGALLGLELQTAPHTVLLGPLPACVLLLMLFPCPPCAWDGGGPGCGGKLTSVPTASSLWLSPALLMKSEYLSMIISNQNSMNKIVNSPNKMQCLHQQNRPLGTLAFVLGPLGASKESRRCCQTPAGMQAGVPASPRGTRRARPAACGQLAS